MNRCLESAYEDFQLLLENIFTNLKRGGFKISYEAFTQLFDQYDWVDIIESLEEAEYLCRSVNHNDPPIDLNEIIPGSNPSQLKSKWTNSYFLEWLRSDN